MKLLVFASALDITLPLGCTPAWWQLLKALATQGVEIVAVPYHGRPVESLWWRTDENPGLRLGAAYTRLRNVMGPRKPRSRRRTTERPSLETRIIRRILTPIWQKHLLSIIGREKNVSAVLILTVPLNHITGIATALRERFRVPIAYFDGDLPSSLPAFGGFGSGFDIYRGADLGEYDLFLSNSQGVSDDLMRLGARRVETLWWGADPQVFHPIQAEEDIDVLFYGHGVDHRKEALNELITLPSQALPHRRFVVAGSRLDMDFGRAECIGPAPPAELSHLVARSRILLNVSRDSHANAYASASTRLFELAAMEQAIVTNPVQGLDEWFVPGREVEVAGSAREAQSTYERLLEDSGARTALARAARQRILQQHTYDHRARQLLEYLSSLKCQ